MRFHKILCAVDFSSPSNEAMCAAADLVRGTDTELVLAHVWQPPYIYGPDTAFPSDFFAESKRHAERDLGTWRASAEHLGAPRVSTALLTGNPWHELVELAKVDPRIDLIVVGTHGRTGLTHALLGSVAEKVVRYAPCPVLVTRKRDGVQP
jgi:nucleotide-binding universal stress UspA family protein